MLTGVLSDDEVTIVECVLAHRCMLLALNPDGPEGKMIAHQLIELFRQGVTDEKDLMTRPIVLSEMRL